MATLETQQLDEVIASSRRRMLTLGGAALAGLAFTSIASAQSSTTLTDADYLNFALNLEFLEANFYTLAATGQTIDQVGLSLKGTGTQGIVVTKGSNNYKSCQVPFKNTAVQNYAMEIAMEERNHVSFLQGALSTSAVAQPQIDLVNSFNTLGGLLGLGLKSFDPFADDASFLLGSYIFEDVGVSAYTGAAPSLTVAGNLDAAAGIQAVEAYHAGLIRTVIYGLDQSTNNIAGAGLTNAPAGTLRTVATAISKLRASVDGAGSTKSGAAQGDDIGLGTQMVALGGSSANLTASTLVDASTTGSINTPASNSTTTGSLAFSRNAAQVLAIVYAGGSGKGGFFPAGLNGNVK